MSTTTIKNIIFDLGGVIIHLDQPKTLQELARLANVSVEEAYSRLSDDGVLHAYEIGKLNDDEFVKRVIQVLGLTGSEEEVREAWNAMLLHIPEEALATLKELANDYRLFMFSNTNAIHIEEVHLRLQDAHGYDDFTTLFERVYYSHEVGERKPDAAAFQVVLKENDLLAEETLFVDDNEDNIKGAAKLGIKTLLFPANQQLDKNLFYGQAKL